MALQPVVLLVHLLIADDWIYSAHLACFTISAHFPRYSALREMVKKRPVYVF